MEKEENGGSDQREEKCDDADKFFSNFFTFNSS
jgi:hypothetical protein